MGAVSSLDSSLDSYFAEQLFNDHVNPLQEEIQHQLGILEPGKDCLITIFFLLSCWLADVPGLKSVTHPSFQLIL